MRHFAGIAAYLLIGAAVAQEPPSPAGDRPPSVRRRGSGAPAPDPGGGYGVSDADPAILYRPPAGPDPAVPAAEAGRRIQAHIDRICRLADALGAMYREARGHEEGDGRGEYIYTRLGFTPAFEAYRNPCDNLRWSLQAVEARGSARASELRYLDEGMARWAEVDRKMEGMYREWIGILKRKRASGDDRGRDDDFLREFDLYREMQRTPRDCFRALSPGEPAPEAPAGAVVRCYAKGASGLRPVSSLVAGVPSIVEIAWAEPPDKDECEVEVAAGGGTLKLKARRIQDERRVYRTDPFLPWPADDLLGPPPPR